MMAVVLFLLALATVACGGYQEMGQIEADSTPISFESIGEILPYWEIELEAGIEYQVTVKPLHEQNWISVDVYDSCSLGDRLPITHIGSPTDTAGISVKFIAPETSKACIYVTPGLGEYQQDLGTFTIEVHQKRQAE